MKYSINDTSLYHINEMESLGWELTVCNSIEHKNSICRSILEQDKSYGEHLYDFLSGYISFRNLSNIIEIGGGYGYLMRDFLNKNSSLAATMIDLSNFLLMEQQKTLRHYNVEFILDNFFNFNFDYFNKYDLAILNENIADFPTICNLNPEFLKKNANQLDKNELKVYNYFKKYFFSNDIKLPFNFNIGAVEAVEKLCNSGVKNIFISEHSCESIFPEEFTVFNDIDKNDYPERIILNGHDEYTIKFSYLAKVADSFNYTVNRGKFIDFIKIKQSEKINIILNSNIQNDEFEIIRHFLYDLYKYEYLILIKR